MKSAELKEKLAAAEEKVNKITATIERHKAQAEKKLAVIRKNNWNENDRYALRETPQYNDSYWAVCEYESKLDDIKGAGRKLTDAQAIVENWKAKLEKQLDLELTIAKEMPEIFRQCQQELAAEWTAYDIRCREKMMQQRKELSYEEFRKLYKYSQEYALQKTDEEFNKMELREAELFIVDLYNRVKAITGNVTDWANIHYGGKALNGWIAGEQGKAKVETIGAGGYNIQRYHLRVLVHEIK
jgi:hypothetical protein